MKKLICLLCIFSLLPFWLSAQTVTTAQENLNTLIEHRSSLFQEWKRNNDERHAFFGGQSKKDLKQVISTQQNIIEVDNRIMDAIEQLNFVKRSSLIEKKDSITAQTFRYNSNEQRLMNLLKQKEDRIASLNREINYHERNTMSLKIAFIISLIAFVGLGMFVWAKKKSNF